MRVASWISASFKSPRMPCQTMVTVAENAYRVSTDLVEREIRQNGLFHNTLSHYSHVLLMQTLRSTACNGLHMLERGNIRAGVEATPPLRGLVWPDGYGGSVNQSRFLRTLRSISDVRPQRLRGYWL